MSDDFLSGDAGDVAHPWRRVKRAAGELAFSAVDRAALVGRRADAIAAATPRQRVLAGCGWHTLRRACPQGVIMGAHAAGRLVEALRPR